GNHATNLMNHLRLKHEDEYKKVVQINKLSVKITEKKNATEDEKDKKRKKLLDSCIKLIAVHGRPFELLDDEAFCDIKALILPDFKNEGNSKKIKDMILDKSYEIKEKITTELKQKMISVKLDSATCLDRQFIGVNVQYIKKNKIVSRTLALQEIFDRQTAENLKLIIIDILGDFGIPLRNIYSITTDNGSNYLKVTSLFNEEIRNENNDSEEETDDENNFNSGVDSFDATVLNDTNEDTESHPFQITSVRCAAHTLQLCVKDAINKNPETDSVIDISRRVVSILRRPLMKIRIRSQKLRKPVIDCNTRWASTYNMLRRLKELKAICDDSEEICQILSENFWLEINKILECLQPAAEATIRLQAEQLTLGDFYSIWIICKNKTENLDFPLAKDIVTSMIHRENLLLQNNAFLAAIFIDPRWKITLSEQEIEIARNWIKDVHRQMCLIHQEREKNSPEIQESSSVLNQASTSRDPISVQHSVPGNNFQTDLQSLESILDETQRVRHRSTDFVRMNFDYFLAEYATTPRLAITEDVIVYWTQKLPNELAEVALVVLAAPATQVTVERLFSTLKFILTPSRNRLLDQTIKSIILIKCNEDMFDD
ncbi:uncharacterized protein LOC114364029, partial [Ostrinia furnacalis]|uniref:uncharacterized protein LOC114364029 n=1 Tax=Ostrinia furnacalis TaxID=93504 RepID=UPI00103FF377